MDIIAILTFCAAIGCGTVGGIFFVFSTFVMRALAELPDEQGVAAMQRINVAALSPPFMLTLFGSAAVCAVLAVYGVVAGDWAVIFGGAIYLIGTIAVTIVFHVPRNDALAKLSPNSPQTGTYWRRYLTTWVAGNHARTISSLVAAGIFIVALTGG